MKFAEIASMAKDELFEVAKQLQVPYDLVLYVHENKKLPVVNFAAGGVATPADAALMMQLGAEGVFAARVSLSRVIPKKERLLLLKLLQTLMTLKCLLNFQKI